MAHLAPGTRLGAFEVVAPVGAGGMGAVYRARDTKLGRDVAIKVLPAVLASDEERRVRFEREARSASALNHPNIVTIHEFGAQDGAAYMVMEFVEGRTLREMLADGALAPRTLLRIAAQAADGLAQAHAAGIVHRDLKPENIMVTSDGLVKLLDFGLAKFEAPALAGRAAAGSDIATLPTQPGIVMGTVSYMSPEQAAGRPVDFRSDQFSLGLILFEMATGRKAFQRPTPVETLSAIIREEAEPVGPLAPAAPAPFHWLIERCLAKEPQDRYASTWDLARDLKGLRDHLPDSSASGIGSAAPRERRAGFDQTTLVTGLALGALAGAGLALWLGRSPLRDPPRLAYLTHSGRDSSPAASPDGQTIAFSSDRDGRPRIWLKQLAGGGEAALTEGPDDYPRFSPDGATILFSRTGDGRVSLYRVPLLGGEPRKVLDDAVDGDWSPDGRRLAFVRTRNENGVTVSVVGVAGYDGSDAREVARFENRRMMHPRWSPDGRTIAVPAGGTAGGIPSAVALVDLDGRHRLLPAPSGAPGQLSAAAWAGPDAVVYSQADSVAGATTGSTARIVRQRLDTGEARTLAWSPNSSGVLDVLGPGRIVFDARSPRENLRELALTAGASASTGRWITRGNSTDRQPVYHPRGEWVAFSSNRGGNLDIWSVSTATGAVRRLTDDAADDWDPAFSADGRQLVWSSNRSGHFEVWICEADGSRARQVSSDGVDAENPTTSPDGQWVVYTTGNPQRAGVWKVRTDGTQATRLVAGATVWPEISPDGRYVLYVTNVVEARVIRVVRLADGALTPFSIRVQSPRTISTSNSLARARWWPDGRAIAFIGQDERGVWGVFAQDFAADAADTSSSRRAVAGFDPDAAAESFGIAPDGRRLTIAGWEQTFSVMAAEGLPIRSRAPAGGR